MKTVDFKHARGPDKLRVYAIGDVHGRLDLLQEMHRLIHMENLKSPPFDWVVVHLGDYVDRGLQSRGVIEFLIDGQRKNHRILALAGNHDVNFVDFLNAGDTYGLFARHGGRQTGLSYGINIDFSNDYSIASGRDALKAVVPTAHVDFLRRLPRSIFFGDFFFCHAGIRPGIELERQDPEDLIWIRSEFLEDVRPHSKVVIHGHTPATEIEIRPNRVNLDTGAYASGRLSAIMIDGQNKSFLEATL